MAKVNVAALEMPLDVLVWADGSTLAGVQPFSLRMLEMHEALQEPGATAADHLALLRLCVPDGAVWTEPSGARHAVDETYRRDMSAPRMWIVFEHAQYKLRQAVELVEEARKNGLVGVEPDSPLPPSSPTTSSTTPSPASPAPSPAAAAGTRTTKRRSTKSSSPLTV